jgi:replication factor C small subunit
MSLLHDLFQEYFRYNVDELNANDSKEYLITHKQKWFEIAEQDYKRQNSGTPGLNFIFKSIFRNFPMMRTFSDVPFRVLIIKDAEYLSMDIQQALRRTMEKSSRTCRFCLICENVSKIIDPIRSRCVILHFNPLDEAQIGSILRYIVSQEHISIGEDALLSIIYLGKRNMIRTINLLQTVASVGAAKTISADSVHQVIHDIINIKLKEMIELALAKDFLSARTKLREIFIQYGLTGTQIMEKIQLLILKLPIPEDSKINLSDLLSEYELRMQKGANEEIHLSAFIAQIGNLELS